MTINLENRLYQELYSQDAPDFTGENVQIIKTIDKVAAHCQGRRLWVIDRGVLFEHLLAKPDPKNFLVRLTGDRYLNYGNTRNWLCPLPIAAKLRTAKPSSNKKMAGKPSITSTMGIGGSNCRGTPTGSSCWWSRDSASSR